MDQQTEKSKGHEIAMIDCINLSAKGFNTLQFETLTISSTFLNYIIIGFDWQPI